MGRTLYDFSVAEEAVVILLTEQIIFGLIGGGVYNFIFSMGFSSYYLIPMLGSNINDKIYISQFGNSLRSMKPTYDSRKVVAKWEKFKVKFGGRTG